MKMHGQSKNKSAAIFKMYFVEHKQHKGYKRKKLLIISTTRKPLGALKSIQIRCLHTISTFIYFKNITNSRKIINFFYTNAIILQETISSEC